jgi:hypothetical protein
MLDTTSDSQGFRWSAMRSIAALALSLLSVPACGGRSPTSAAPPSAPNLIGNWSGTRLDVLTSGAANISNTCKEVWSITSQTEGQFSGTFHVSGGTTASCETAGTVSGTISADNRVSGLAFSVDIPSGGCTRSSGDGRYSGQLVNGVMTATTSDSVACFNFTAVRNLTITMRR